MGEDVATAVVVVSYGSSDLVEQNFAHLGAAGDGIEMIVVDCFSSSSESSRVADLCRRRGWHALTLEENLGFGGGVDRGAGHAFARGADVVVVVNPDATLSVPAVHALAADVADDPLALVSPRILKPDGSLWNAGADLYLDDGSIAGIRHRESFGARPRMFWLTGACFAVSRELWQRVGGFVDDYFLYWEDVDLSARVHDVGGELRVRDDISATHDEGGTHDDRSTSRAKSETYYYYNIRNRILFARLRMDAAAQSRWRRHDVRVSWGIILQGGRRQLVTSIAPWRALLRGLRDGRRGVTGAYRG